MRFELPSLLLIFVCLILISGCTQRETVLAVIGKNEGITVEDFHMSFGGKKSMQALQSMDLTEKKKQLNRIIDRRIRLLAAFEAGLDEDEFVTERVEAMKKRRVIQKLYEVEILDHLIRESEIREYYARMAKEVVLRKIVINAPVPPDSAKMVEAKARAENLTLRARSGEDFSLLAREFSEDPGTARKGGLMEPMSWKSSLDPILTAAYSMKVGDVTDPIQTRQGFNVVMLEEIREKDRKPYDEVRDEIKRTLTREKTPVLQQGANVYMEALKRSNHVKYFDDNLTVLTDHVKGLEDPVPAKWIEIIDGLDETDRSRVLVSYQEKDFIIGSFSTVLEEFPEERPLYINTSTQLKSLIDRWLTQELLVERALKKRLDRDPEIENSLNEVRETYTLQLMDERVIYGDLEISEEDIESHYRAYKEEKYIDQARVKVQEILIKDEDIAGRVARIAKSGHNFDELVQQYTERVGYKKRNGVVNFFTRDRWGAMGEAAFRLKLGEIEGPIDLGNNKGFSIIKLLDRKPARIRELEEVRGLVENDLAKTIKEERERAWLEQYRAKYGVYIDEGALELTFSN